MAPHLAEMVAAENEAVRQIEKALDDYPDEIAALIIEPIQGEGGDNHFRPEFLRKLRELADQHEFLFIADEVQTGVGLTGKMWAYQHFGFTPDVLVVREEDPGLRHPRGPAHRRSGEKRLPRVHAHQFDLGRKPDGHGSLRPLPRDHRGGKAGGTLAPGGAHLLAELEKLQGENADRISNARGRGLMCAFDLPDTDTRDRFKKLAFENGMLILGSGRRSIRFRPTLSVGKKKSSRESASCGACCRASKSLLDF